MNSYEINNRITPFQFGYLTMQRENYGVSKQKINLKLLVENLNN